MTDRSPLKSVAVDARQEARPRRGRGRSTLGALAATVLIAVSSLSVGLGCAVTDKDLQRWETTQEGPRRLRAVVMHDKYPQDLRVKAAMALIHMKPRKGQRVGIKELVENTLAQLPPDVRGKLVADLVPLIIEELARQAPSAQPGQQAPPDPSFPYKDAAYLMLTFERTNQGPTIIADPELRKQLEKALIDWAMADFERRLADRSQAYGMEQLLRYIGSPAVVALPQLMTKNTKALTTMADLVAKLGDGPTKEEAGKKLVEIATYISSDRWLEDHKAELEEANRKAQIEPTDKQFELQLLAYQNESLLRVFGSMKQVGGAAAVSYCLDTAADTKRQDKQRQAALAALEGRIAKDDAASIERILAIAASDAPDIVLDQAFRRIRELPRDKVIHKVYDLFKTDRWKLRRAAGATALQMSTVKDIDEFMRELGRKAEKNFSLSEAIAFGAYLGELKEGDARGAIKQYLTRGAVQARLSAIGYFYTYGTKADLDVLKPLEDDGEKIPKCEEDGDCGWECEVPKKDDPKTREPKTITTVGEYVLYCIEPQVALNAPKTSKPAKDGNDGKGASSAPATPEDGAAGG